MAWEDAIVECVVNINTAHRSEVIDLMIEQVTRTGLSVIHRDSGVDADRTVLTLLGRPNKFLAGIDSLYQVAVGEGLDISIYKGNHPSVGIVDVVPFVPIKDITMEELQTMVRDWAPYIADKYDLPIVYYGSMAHSLKSQYLSHIRKGGIATAKKRLSDGQLIVDYGPQQTHTTLGLSCWTVRDLMVAYNVSLDTQELSVAKAIANEIKIKRTTSPNLKEVRVLGWKTPHFNCCQISANVYDISTMTMSMFFHIVEQEAKTYGVEVKGSELIGVAPYAGYDKDASPATMDELVDSLGLSVHAPFIWEQRVLEKLTRYSA